MTERGLERLAQIGIDLDGPAAKCARVPRGRSAGPAWTGASAAATWPASSAPPSRRHYFARGYVRRIRESRALDVTPRGRKALRDMFGVAELV